MTRSLPDEYCERLKDEKILSEDVLQNTIEDHTKFLTEQLWQADDYIPERYHLQLQWQSIIEPDYVSTTWDTGTDVDLLKFVGAKSVECPEGFVSGRTILFWFLLLRINEYLFLSPECSSSVKKEPRECTFE